LERRRRGRHSVATGVFRAPRLLGHEQIPETSAAGAITNKP
jgi:hypothetical protein